MNNEEIKEKKTKYPISRSKKTEIKKVMETAESVKKPLTDDEKIEEFKRKAREEIDKCPKVNFIVPLEAGEKPGAVQVVSLNGYTLTIKKGAMVEIPKPFAEILAEKFNIEMTAGQEMRVDRSDNVSSALS